MRMVKRIFALALAMLFCACAALAEGMIGFDEYVRNLSALTDVEWSESGLVRVLDLGDELTVSVCLIGENVAAVTVESAIDGDAEAVAEAALDALGCLNPEAIAVLEELDGGDQATCDGCVFGKLEGGRRMGFYAALEEDFDDLVWQSVHGGSKYHAKPGCSGMDVARLVTREAAMNMGYEPCGRCHPDSKNNGGSA